MSTCWTQSKFFQGVITEHRSLSILPPIQATNLTRVLKGNSNLHRPIIIWSMLKKSSPFSQDTVARHADAAEPVALAVPIVLKKNKKNKVIRSENCEFCRKPIPPPPSFVEWRLREPRKQQPWWEVERNGHKGLCQEGVGDKDLT